MDYTLVAKEKAEALLLQELRWETIMINLGKKINSLRKKKGLTLENLALQVGASKSYIWEIENRPKLHPSAMFVYKLSVVLGVTVDSLLSGNLKHSDEDEAFFCKYKKLSKKVKKQLRDILNVIE